jgi:hypothetical protein
LISPIHIATLERVTARFNDQLTRGTSSVHVAFGLVTQALDRSSIPSPGELVGETRRQALRFGEF